MNKQKKQSTLRLLLLALVILTTSTLLYYFLNQTSDNKEGFDKVSLHSWWGNDTESIEMFEHIFKNIDKKVEIYSVMGGPPAEKKENTIYVQYSGESYHNDPTIFDVNFIPSEITADNIIPFPFGLFNIIHANETQNVGHLVNTRRLQENKQKFCIFAVSNGAGEQRNRFFHKLSEYKKVDSCGRHLTNMENCPGNWGSKEYLEFISQYKFMICFENGSVPDYLTEKVINAYVANTIPIYWGCPNVSDYVNMDAILYLKPDFTEDDVQKLIDEIQYLDNNDDAYRAKYESAFFKNDQLPKELDINYLQKIVTERLGP